MKRGKSNDCRLADYNVDASLDHLDLDHLMV